VAHLSKAFWQHVVQESAQELDACQAERAQSIAADFSPAKGDALVVDAQDALVGNRDLEDVWREILDAGFGVRDRPAVPIA